MATILTKKSDTASAVPLAADLTNAAGGAELAVNATDKRLFSKTSGGTVVELGTNPTAMAVVGNTTVGGTLGVTGATTLAGVSATTLSASSTVTLSGGTANGVAYLNGSKVVTSGSALTFDGTRLTSTTGKFGGGAASNSASLMVNNATNTATGIQLFQDGIESWIMGMPANSAGLAWSASGSEQMRLTSTGLGIGTSSPAYKLDVQGATGTTTSGVYETSASGSSIVISRLRTTGTGRGYWDIRTGNTASGLTGALDFFDNIAGASRLNLDSSGNLGLGVTPSAWNIGKAIDISVSGAVFGDGVNTAYTAGLSQNAYLQSNVWKYKVSSQPASRYELNGAAHAWFNAPSGTAGNAITFTQAMTLDASGNLLVGTTSNGTYSEKFNVTTGSATQTIMNLVATGTSSFGAVKFRNGSGEIGSISYLSAAVVYNTTSDYRLKTVIGAVTGHGARIDALEPIEYEWKSDGSRTRGFLAHKFQEVYADSVTGTKDAVDADGNPVYQQMQASTSEVIADLVAEIQSLRKRLADAGI